MESARWGLDRIGCLTPMGVVAEIERTLCRLRMAQLDDGVTDLRTSTMTHIVWAPPPWLPRARKVLHGLAERHPARTIFLVPEPGRADRISARASLRDFPIGDGREVLSEVVEIRLSGRAAQHPASIVLPLLISDLPAFCRWRGEPDWGGSALAEIASVCDRLVVDSSEWRRVPDGYANLVELFDRLVVSDIAWRRTAPWRGRLAERWPAIRSIDKLRVDGPRADAHLLAGWLRSRLRRRVDLTWRRAEEITSVRVDGDLLATPSIPAATWSALLSAELDTLVRDPVYEAAARAA
jgi:glucose-6-phosphate dehydrogenase assembly protein OpcA